MIDACDAGPDDITIVLEDDKGGELYRYTFDKALVEKLAITPQELAMRMLRNDLGKHGVHI